MNKVRFLITLVLRHGFAVAFGAANVFCGFQFLDAFGRGSGIEGAETLLSAFGVWPYIAMILVGVVVLVRAVILTQGEIKWWDAQAEKDGIVSPMNPLGGRAVLYPVESSQKA